MSPRASSLLVAVLALIVAACAGARGGARGPTTRIEGQVHGHDGRIPSLAHARVIDPSTMQPLAQVEVGKDGSFVLKSRHAGLAWLELTAVDNAMLQVPVMLEGGTLGLDATLGTYPAGDPDAPVQLFAWAGDPERTEPMLVDMKPGPDGTFVADVATKARKLRVQVGNLAPSGRAVNPPGASAHEYDGGGDYRGIYTPQGGKLHLEVRPGARPIAVAPKLVLTPADGAAARVAALGELWQPWRPARADDAAKLWARARASDDVLVKRLATAMALATDQRADTELAPDERALASALVASTPVGDSLWPMMAFGLARAVDLGGDPAHAKLLERVVTEQLPPQTGGMVLLSRLAAAHERGDKARAQQLYSRLQQAPYAELGLGEMATAWNPARKLARGATLPTFEVAALGAKGRVRSDELRGKLVLVELWATWCQPCIEGMDELHALHREYGDAGFEILAISMDEGEGEITELRKRWPMPWKHAFAGEDREKLYATFETATLPYSVLVDPSGKILEESASPMRGKLRTWLEKHARREPASAEPAPAELAPAEPAPAEPAETGVQR